MLLKTIEKNESSLLRKENYVKAKVGAKTQDGEIIHNLK